MAKSFREGYLVEKDVDTHWQMLISNLVKNPYYPRIIKQAVNSWNLNQETYQVSTFLNTI